MPTLIVAVLFLSLFIIIASQQGEAISRLTDEPDIMADSSSKSNSNDDLDVKQASVPAWKLREGMRAKGTPLRGNSAHNVQKLRQKSQESVTVDPNLPPAFRVVFQQRAAFSKQQARRKNNDEFVSLNSSHPVQVQTDDSDHSSDFNDSFASMGEDIAEEDEGEEE
jgi:hypothetical protein